MSQSRMGEERQAAKGGIAQGWEVPTSFNRSFNEKRGDRMPRIRRAVVGVKMASLFVAFDRAKVPDSDQ